ncbi:ComEA family DNA-binding protein [Corynebacterium sp. zg254]|uniref:ComEA family DNA-binding protein n=1 Tax=Corynebacterium zhongnanshanii TaxID=2768834 RepID=A0ABQ6VDJ9_9CORY|nr:MULTISPECIES: helix-hairpin-helix domain-containing protein [Corynebacterium]KAB3520932.1 ComEA family DNA-binding protein [Corynebacterium zhongnanshanii]MCR5914562.1 ComEA family DNA-binding protein [Corynebacterium sp. zg254]
MGAQPSSATLRAIQERIESFVQPMAEHDVQTVDVETRTALHPRSAKALIVVVAVATVAVGIVLGLKVMGGEPSEPEAGGVSQWGQLAPAGQDTAGGTASSATVSADARNSTAGQDSAAVGASDKTDTIATAERAAGPAVVSIQGMVAHPGLLRLDPSTRVGEAIDAAGGTVPGANIVAINLAARISDGMQIVVDDHGSTVVDSLVRAPGEVAPAAGSGTAGGGVGVGPGGTINLNTATEAQLQTLQGVGPSTARAIIAWREANGRFASVEQLLEVKGIGPAKFDAIKGSVSIG